MGLYSSVHVQHGTESKPKRYTTTRPRVIISCEDELRIVPKLNTAQR